MNYEFREFTYPSTDGVHTVYAEIYVPVSAEIKGIVQLAHGMIDHTGRYKELANYLTGEGYVFAGNHHLGHGKTVTDPNDYGYFTDKGGVNFVVRDLHRFNRYLRDTFPNQPVVIFGHSMGSFLTRMYVERYPHSIKAAIIHGTAGKNPALPFGRILTSVVRRTHTPHYRSEFVNKLAFGKYNINFPKSEGERAWLSRDNVLAREKDEYVNFAFTVAGYSDLFKMLTDCNRRDWFIHYPRELPTLIVSGTADPVGGKEAAGPKFVYKRLLRVGCKNVTLKLYEGARHELFRETNREEVFRDITEWINYVLENHNNHY